MKVYGVQHAICWEDKAATHARVEALLRGVEIAPGSLIVLPEMFATGFSMNVPAVTETPERQTEEFLANLAREKQAYVLGGLVTTGPAGKGLNQAVVVGPHGGELARYIKMQPFTPGGESARYAAGTGPVLFLWQGFTVAPFICYDLRFPEHFRAAVRMGAQVFVVIASWPTARESHWLTLLQARAIENQAYVIGVNRCGRDPKLEYSGRSLIVSPTGEVLADAANGESVVSANLDSAFLTEYRHSLPFLADMKQPD